MASHKVLERWISGTLHIVYWKEHFKYTTKYLGLHLHNESSFYLHRILLLWLSIHPSVLKEAVFFKTIVKWHGRKNQCLMRSRRQLILIYEFTICQVFRMKCALESVCASSFGPVSRDCFIFRNLARHFLNSWELKWTTER